jgi:GST-like protein
MYTLYGYKGSGSAAVEAALERIPVPYKLVAAASWDPESALDELRRVNPLAQVPTLVLADGTVLSESAAILIHLGLAHPQSGLLPTAPSARAAAMRGLVFIAANCYSAISVTDFPDRWLVDASDNAQQNLRDGSRARLHLHWATFTDTFQPAPYLSGARLGALDLLAAVVTKWSGARPFLEQERPVFHQLLRRIDEEAGVKAVFGRHWPEQD